MPADFDPSIQTEEIGFRGDQLVACDRCGRQNAPNRLECIYCGAPLDVQPDAVEKVSVRRLESWEPGTSIVINGDGDVAKAAELLSLDREQIEDILAAGVSLPVAWIEEKSANVIEEKLRELGFTCIAVADGEIELRRPPIRISAMSFSDDRLELVDLNTRESHRHSWDDLVLIVQGIFSTGKIDSMEKRRLRKTTALSDTTTSADEQVFDLYAADGTIGYRVQLAGFDYSCLGDRMTPLAGENMSRLIDELRTRAPGVKVVNDYKHIRHLLNGIWDIESRKDPTGPRQVGFGKREFGVVHSTSNVAQFTRFSRLQRLML